MPPLHHHPPARRPARAPPRPRAAVVHARLGVGSFRGGREIFLERREGVLRLPLAQYLGGPTALRLSCQGGGWWRLGGGGRRERLLIRRPDFVFLSPTAVLLHIRLEPPHPYPTPTHPPRPQPLKRAPTCPHTSLKSRPENPAVAAASLPVSPSPSCLA